MRLDGVGDILFMQPAVRAHKQLHPDTPLILYTTGPFRPLGELIGFDDSVTQPRQTVGKSPSNNFCTALETHPGSYALDRVSLWEKIFGLPVTDEPVRFTLPDGGREIIEQQPLYDASKPILFFAPIGIRQRRWSQGLVKSMWPGLLREYNVVVASEHGIPKGLGVDHALRFANCSMKEWFQLVGACDVALSHDTGALYLAGGAGIPTVGSYEQVPPWLRMKRFATVRAVRLRRPECKCDHHSPCPNGKRTCYDDIKPAELMRHLEEARTGRFGMWDARTGRRIAAPTVEIILGGIPKREQEEARDAALGLDVTFVQEQTGQADYAMRLEPGKPLRSHLLWMAIAHHERAGNPQKQRAATTQTGMHVATSP